MLLGVLSLLVKLRMVPSPYDNLAEWSKALDLGSSPKGREFKSHSCHLFFVFPTAIFVFAIATPQIHAAVNTETDFALSTG